MINPSDIMHPEDMKALQILHGIPFIDTFCRYIIDVGYERLYCGENLATMLKANKHCLPKVYQLMKKVTSKIGISMPDVYVYNDPVMNAFTFGETKPFVCISSSCVEKLTDDELICLMAHECGHILCKHVLYSSVVQVLYKLGEKTGYLSYTLSGPAYLALLYWYRKSELSADRCAAVVSDEKTFQRLAMKLTSGLSDIGNDPYQLVRQAREYHNFENKSLWNKIQQNCRVAFYSHPQMVNRAYEIDRWKNSWQYRRLI